MSEDLFDVGVLGLIAGKGQFPFLVARGARAKGLKVVAAGFPGNTDPALAAEVDACQMLKLGQLGRLISYFKSNGVRRVVMAGGIDKPRAMDVSPDWRALKLLFKMPAKGDDVLLRAVAAELEGEGMPVVAPHVLLPDLLTPEGVLTRRRPTDEEWRDLALGYARAKAIGALDIGQSVVVRQQVVVAVEAIEGTDAAIVRAGGLVGPGCVVVKVCKPGQDRRVDLPAVGRTTLEVMRDVRAVCLGVEAGRSLFFDLAQGLEIADAAGLAVVGLSETLLADWA